MGEVLVSEPPSGVDRADRITWRRLTGEDFPRLASWLGHPHVHRWWHHDSSAEAVERDFGPTARGEEPAEDLLVHLDGRAIGLVQRARLGDYPAYLSEITSVVPVPRNSVTLDYLIGSEADTGQGIGTDVIRALVRATFLDYADAAAVVVAVVAANTASWRALEKAGFQRVGAGPMEPDNPIDDARHYVYRIDRPAGRAGAAPGGG
ncbi:MAG: acetyltransferase [Actinomycetota bacterium]|nr:acetyltransferase [Actinomycetota bacterium]